MNFVKCAQVPVLLTISAIIAIFLNESKLNIILLNNPKLRSILRSYDLKTFMFFTLSFVFIIMGFLIDCAIFCVKNKRRKLFLKKARMQMNGMRFLIFMSVLCAYIMKVEESVLFKFVLSMSLQFAFYFLAMACDSPTITFICLGSLYCLVLMLFSFSFVASFASTYQALFGRFLHVIRQ
ncbi:hypothetical protein EDEG_00796 [Edhazardia aedis USNM 41457]|uniref:Uncharacterized protein n=1 Tax=Edhazardia aedis (strain USNM 41457) TaxID=1003232 RepID=J9DBL4_EDHAE|nr:hypothetical protein EDEG_00796 [Edhazardia aedis USNM 41457]|eukprot:EJW05111.1 hypothetical protein EDEG_00796 [Edhazardia aedis USNM 41457]